MNIFQQVFANVNRRNSDLILRKENTDQNQLGYLKKSPIKKRKPMPKGKKNNLKKKDGPSQLKSANDIKEAIEPVLEERVRTLDSIIDANLITTMENNKNENELEDDNEIVENNDNGPKEEEEANVQPENQSNETVENEELLSLSTAVPEEKTQEIIGNLLKSVQIEKKIQTPVKSDNVDLTNITPKNENMMANLTPKSASRLPRKINSIPKDRDYMKIPIPEIIIASDIGEDEMREKYIYVSEKLYSTQLQLEEANERNKQLEDRVYELEMRLNEMQLNMYQGQ